MLLDNTQWIGGNGLNLKGMPRSTGLAAFMDDIDWTDPNVAVPAANSELLYLTNLWRQAKGLPPVNPATNAPTVNVGLYKEEKNALILSGVGLAILFFISRKKR